MPPTSSESAPPAQSALSDPHFWHNLFSPDGYMPRRICGIWTPGEIRLHNISDFLIWAAYVAIPLVLLFFVVRLRTGLPFRSLFVLFGLFIVSCGTTHFMEIVMFYCPVYRLAGLIKFVTAVVSWATIAALIPAIPKVLAMRSPDELEREVNARTEELRVLNTQKDELLGRTETARREAEQSRHEAERSREEAENANRTKDEFLMTLSHELRTPLNSILGWSSLLRMGGLDQTTQTEALVTIEKSCMAQTRLVDDILEVSRIITGKMVIERQPVELGDVVSSAYNSVAAIAREKGVALSLHMDDRYYMVRGDAVRLQQIVWNLLSNAIKFTPEGGKIAVSLRHLDPVAELEIKDSGEGIDPEFLPQIFDRFRQADSSSTRTHGGLGLGLSIVRYLVEMHGGEINIESAGEGQGTTARITLPLRVGAHTQPATPTPNQSRSDGLLCDLKILVVDDDPQARHLVSTILTTNGAQTRLASSTGEAWEQLEKWQPDLLISDIGMPRENGYQLMERVRRTPSLFQNVPALALTAYVSGDDRMKAREAGFDSHLPKPILPDALLREVMQVMGLKK